MHFEEGVCREWVPVRSLAPPPQPAPESNDLPGYRAVVTLKVSAEEDRAVVFSGVNLGEPQLVRLLLNGRLWLLEMCLFSKSPAQQHLVDQVSVSPLPDNCLLC